MKKTKNFIIVVLLFLIAAFLYLGINSDDKNAIISGRESFYIDDKSTENLYKLCKELYGYTDYDKILKYYPKYLDNDVAYNFYMQSVDNEFLAKQHVDSFKLDYCFSLLHTSNTEQFKIYFDDLKDSISNVNLIYYYLAAEIETRDYSNENLREIIGVLTQLEKETSEDNKESLLSNLSLQSYIYNLLKEDELYLKTITRIDIIEQSGDGSMIDPENN